MTAADGLTERRFWEDEYLAPIPLPARPSERIPVERCTMRMFERLAPAERDARVLEVGCAPGRWLVFYAERFGARVEGLEYTTYGAEQTRQNLESCGVDGTIHEDDFWSWEPDEPFDLVLSLGFVEHFLDLDAVFERQRRFVRPGGRLVVTVPNFQGVNAAVQRICDGEWLALHNPAAMGDRNLSRLAERHGLRVDAQQYFGGFDPDVISTRKRGRRLLAPAWHLRRRGYGDAVNAWWLSSFLVVVCRRPAAS